MVEAVDRRIGNVKSSLEVLDVSTPATVIRYTGNWKGSFEGWIMNKKSGFRGLKKTLPGLKDFYMAGQWVEPGGGLPSCILSARNVAQILCREDGKKFVTQSF